MPKKGGVPRGVRFAPATPLSSGWPTASSSPNTSWSERSSVPTGAALEDISQFWVVADPRTSQSPSLSEDGGGRMHSRWRLRAGHTGRLCGHLR